MRFIIVALALMAMFSTASGVNLNNLERFARYEQLKGAMKMKQILQKQQVSQQQPRILKKPRKTRVDYFDQPFYGYTCENMGPTIPSGNPYNNPFKPDDLSDIIAETRLQSGQLCGIYFTIDVRTLALACLPANVTQCVPLKKQSSIMYIIKATDFDGMAPPMGSLPNSPANTDIWTAAYGSNNPLGFVAQNYQALPSGTGGVPGMNPFTSDEDRMQYQLYVHGVITADMDAEEVAGYSQWARMTGTKVAPTNAAIYGTDNDQLAQMVAMQSAAGTTATDSTASTGAGADSTALNNPALNYMAFGLTDADDMMPMAGMGGMGGMNMMPGLDNLVLKAYRMGQKHENHRAQRLRATRKSRGMMPEFEDMYGYDQDEYFQRQLMQQMMAAQTGTAATTGTDTATATAAATTAATTPAATSPTTPTRPTISPMLAGCLNGEWEDLQQYNTIQTMGPMAFQNPDMDAEERVRYYQCAKMHGDTQVVKAFAQGGINQPASGLAPMARNTFLMGEMDSEDMLKFAMSQGINPFAASPSASTATAGQRLLRKPRGYGPDEDVLEMQMYMRQFQGTGVQVNPNNGWMMYGEDLYEDGLWNLMNMGQSTTTPTAPTTATDTTSTGTSTTAAGSATTTTTATTPTAPATPVCGSYKGMVPVDGVDEGEFMMNAALVRDVQACMGMYAVNDGINSDTIAMYLVRRQLAPPQRRLQ